MSPFVLEQLSAASEFLVAVRAGVGFLAAVHAQVNDEPLFDRKRFGADLALERLDARVTRQMSLERAHLRERLVADVAFKWPFALLTKFNSN